MSAFANPDPLFPSKRDMRKLLVVLSLTLAPFLLADTTNEIAARFQKTKHKQKHGVSRYLKIESTPVVRASYSGTFRARGLDHVIDLDSRSGRDHHGAFTLRNVRIDGAHLIATKVYTNGTTGKLEGAFLRQVVREGTSPANSRITSDTFGLGVIDLDFVIEGGIELDKLIFEGDMLQR